jgi:hypothetical protein
MITLPDYETARMNDEFLSGPERRARSIGHAHEPRTGSAVTLSGPRGQRAVAPGPPLVHADERQVRPFGLARELHGNITAVIAAVLEIGARRPLRTAPRIGASIAGAGGLRRGLTRSWTVKVGGTLDAVIAHAADEAGRAEQDAVAIDAA